MRLKLTIAGSLLGKAVGLGFFDGAESVKLLSDKKAVEAEVVCIASSFSLLSKKIRG